MVPRVSRGLPGLMKRAAGVLGPWELEHSWQRAKGPSIAIAQKCLAIPRTSTVEKLKPVDLKFFREDFPFLYPQEKRLTLKTVGTDIEEKPSENREKQLFSAQLCAPHGHAGGVPSPPPRAHLAPEGAFRLWGLLRGRAREGKRKNLALAYHCRDPRERGDKQMEIEED